MIGLGVFGEEHRGRAGPSGTDILSALLKDALDSGVSEFALVLGVGMRVPDGRGECAQRRRSS